MVRSRNGFTLVETLITVVVFGLVALIGYPKLSTTMHKSNLRSARGAMINLITKAQIASSQLGKRTWIKFEGNKAYVMARPPRTTAGGRTADTVGAIMDLSEVYGTTVTFTAGSDSIQFSPTGVASGLNVPVYVWLARNGYRDSLRIDGLGRVTK